MIVELYIKNFGIVDEVRWGLRPGLNIITGETGAGKSLLIEALSVLLGGKGGEEYIRSGEKYGRVEGVFDLSRLPKDSVQRKILSELGLEDDVIVISRELGKRTGRINGRSFPLKVIERLGSLLVDIQSPSYLTSMRDPHLHLSFLDTFSKANELRREVEGRVKRLKEKEGELLKLSSVDEKRKELLSFQIDEIKRAGLREGEEERLIEERERLLNSEKIKSLSEEALELLYTGDGSSTELIGKALISLRELARIDKGIKELSERLEEALYTIEDVGERLRRYKELVDFEPGRIEEIESRLTEIRDIKRKYGGSVEEVFKFLERAEKELSELSSLEERKGRVEEEIKNIRAELGWLCLELSNLRREGARRLEEEVGRGLEDVGLGGVEFKVRVETREAEDGIELPDGRKCLLHPWGIDEVEFYVSTNPGEPLKPLSKTASTGEMSRFLLLLKSILSRSYNIPVLVFDEIDIGVGRSGEIIGKKLYELSKEHQVLCITHLPQVAVFADTHFCVRKEVRNGRVRSNILELSEEERVREIRDMMGKDVGEEEVKRFIERIEGVKNA